MDVQTATETAKTISTMNWPGVIFLLLSMLAALSPFYLWLLGEKKSKKEGKEELTRKDLEESLIKLKPTCIFDKKTLEDVEEKINTNKEILRSVVEQLKTEESYSKRIEENVDRVRKSLADLTETLGKIVR